MWIFAGLGSRSFDVSALLVEIVRSSTSRARGRHLNFPDAHFVALICTPAMHFASFSVMSSIFPVVGGLIIMSRGRSSILALTLSIISDECVLRGVNARGVSGGTKDRLA